MKDAALPGKHNEEYVKAELLSEGASGTSEVLPGKS